MMDKIEYENGIVRVVTPHELEPLTRSGWRVIGVYQDTTPLYTVPAAATGYHSSGGGHISVSSGTVTHFLVVKDEKSVIAELTLQLDQAVATRRKVEDDLRTASKKLADAEAAVVSQVAATKRLTIQECRLECERHRQGARKLEADIAKLRMAIGARTFEEILGTSC